MKIYLLILYVASSYALNFKCLEGPNYYCSSYSKAEECGRVVECFMNDRSDQNGVIKMSNNVKEMKEKNRVGDVKCELCKKIVAELESQFIPNFTEQQFIDYVVNHVCTRLNNEYKSLCTTLVKQYGHDIYIQLKNYIDPAFVCKLLINCPTVTGDFKIPNSPETCKVCKEIFGFLESLLNSVTPDELKSLFKLAICGQLPGPAKEMCNTLVDGYTDQIYNLLKSLLDGDRVCPAIHLCSSQPSRKAQSWNCDTCVDVIGVLRKDLVNISPAQVEGLIKNLVCSKVPFIARGFCDDSVDKYVPQFMSDLHSGLTPQQICAKNALCLEPPMVKKTPVKESLKGVVECDACELVVGEVKKLLLSEAGEIRVKNFLKNDVCKYFGSKAQECAQFVDKYGDILINFINTELTSRQICEMFGACSETARRTKPSSKKLTGIECEACTFVLTKIKVFVADPAHETLLKNFIRNDLCSLFPKEKTQCQQVVDEYFNIIFNALITELDVTKICQLLHLCSATKPVVKVSGAVECKVCEVAMSEVISLITAKASQQRITDILTIHLCPRLGFLRSECIAAVKNYLPYLLEIARESLNSQILCSRLHLCEIVSQKNVQAMMKSMEQKSFQCNLCQYAVNETKALLSDASIQTMIENFLKQEVCARLGPKQQECENDINEYYSFVINLILEFLTPSLCSEIGLCTSSTRQTIRQPIVNLVKSKKDCEVCSLFYKFLKEITFKTSNNDILLGLVTVCGRYAHEDKAKCLRYLKNSDLIFHSFTKAKNEVEFCEMSGMCAKKHETRILGREQCVWGPGFWCVSRKHAELCGIGAVRHCETNVWKANPTI